MRLFQIAAILLLAAHAHAATIAVPENVGPWGIGPGLPAGERGVFADLAAALAARTQVSIEIKFVPFGRMLQEVQSGGLDYAFGVVGPATRGAASFTTVMAKVPMVAVARKGLSLHVLTDLRGFAEIGYVRGGSCGAEVDGDSAIHRVGQDGYVSAIRKLAAGRLDGWCSVKAGFAYALKTMKMQDQMGDQLEYGAAEIAFQVSAAKVNSPEANALSSALARMVDDGEAGRIFAHYLGAPYPP